MGFHMRPSLFSSDLYCWSNKPKRDDTPRQHSRCRHTHMGYRVGLKIGVRPFALGLFAALLIGGVSFALISSFAAELIQMVGL